MVQKEQSRGEDHLLAHAARQQVARDLVEGPGVQLSDYELFVARLSSRTALAKLYRFLTHVLNKPGSAYKIRRITEKTFIDRRTVREYLRTMTKLRLTRTFFKTETHWKGFNKACETRTGWVSAGTEYFTTARELIPIADKTLKRHLTDKISRQPGGKREWMKTKQLAQSHHPSETSTKSSGKESTTSNE